MQRNLPFASRLVVSVPSRLRSLPAQVAGPAQSALPVVAYFLTPISLLAFSLAFWRLGEDMGYAKQFAISEGLFSHWIVWLAVGIALRCMAVKVSRLAR